MSSSQKQDELGELKRQLREKNTARQKDALRRIINQAGINIAVKDIVGLYDDVVNAAQTDDLDLKQLIYIYLNITEKHAFSAKKALNTVSMLVRDSESDNPILRARAIRYMKYIKDEKMLDHVLPVLKEGLSDKDPFVVKAAVLTLPQLYKLSPNRILVDGLLHQLHGLLSSDNPAVASNAAVAALDLMKCQDVSYNLTKPVADFLLATLSDCGEWNQVAILEALSLRDVTDSEDASVIVERVTPLFNAANHAVKLCAVNVVLRQMEHITDSKQLLDLQRDLSVPLLKIMALGEPAVQQAALRSMTLILQRWMNVLSPMDVKAFFIKYNDPPYVKIGKLDILMRLISPDNIDQVLLELQSYALDVDPQIVARAVRVISVCAVNLDQEAQKCVNVLMELISSKNAFLSQQCIVAFANILRRYPGSFDGVLSLISDVVDTVEEADAKVALLWIVGEHAQIMNGAVDLVESYSEDFESSDAAVKLALVLAAVRLHLVIANEQTQVLVTSVLKKGDATDDPDVRQRALFYWRLLAAEDGGVVAKKVVLAQKPLVEQDLASVHEAVLKEYLLDIPHLAAVFHLPGSAFNQQGTTFSLRQITEASIDDSHSQAATGENITGGDRGYPSNISAGNSSSGNVIGSNSREVSSLAQGVQQQQQPPTSTLDDLLGLDDIVVPAPPMAQAQPPPQPTLQKDPFDLVGTSTLMPQEPLQPSTQQQNPFTQDFFEVQEQRTQQELKSLVTREQGKGLEIYGKLNGSLQKGDVFYELEFKNFSSDSLDGFLIQLKQNKYGLSPLDVIVNISSLSAGSTAKVSQQLIVKPDRVDPTASEIQVAIKTNQLGLVYFSDDFDS
eukprot:TRINITY_DN170_c1_g2_i2.p1 TRINITY_DN170_c1_g2~~TRINITY_DN170_c1_g2_i2.p1  ORF type:complete len:845 (-),score=102.22 TRINITY_DN170_c1_g2_i2:252-2786(-)